MKHSLSSIISQVDPIMAFGKSISVLLSSLVGIYLTGVLHEESKYLGAMLASIAGIVALQSDLKSSITQGWMRVLGTFVGSVIAVIYLILFSFSIIGMVISIFFLELMCMLIKIPDNGKMAAIAMVVIMTISQRFPDISPLVNGLLRFVEASAGAIIGVSIAWIIELIRKKKIKI